MTTQQHFYDMLMAWGMGLVFVIIVIIIACTAAMICSETGQEMITRWHEDRIARKKITLRAKLQREGIDPEYIKLLEKENKLLCGKRCEWTTRGT